MYVSLTSSDFWDAIFARLGQTLPHLERLCLSILKTGGNGTINLQPVWEDDSKDLSENSRSQIYFVYSKEFSAEDIRKGLEFRPMPQVAFQGSQAVHSWLESIQREYRAP